ncbi:MAG: hypothetical protein M0R32_09360 [Candidatus Cloacimonetes bacterium]|jgi:hypothetical protein|nr:hypothetical protein [Candidatus Cloacimonadota bacterium]
MKAITDDFEAFCHDMRTGQIDINKTYHCYMGSGLYLSAKGSDILKSLEELDSIFEKEGE